MSHSFFWDVIYRSFETVYPSHFQGWNSDFQGSRIPTKTAWPLKMGRIVSSETSVSDYQSTLRNITEEGRPSMDELLWNLMCKNYSHYRRTAKPFWTTRSVIWKVKVSGKSENFQISAAFQPKDTERRCVCPGVKQPGNKCGHSCTNNVVVRRQCVYTPPPPVWLHSSYSDRFVPLSARGFEEFSVSVGHCLKSPQTHTRDGFSAPN